MSVIACWSWIFPLQIVFSMVNSEDILQNTDLKSLELNKGDHKTWAAYTRKLLHVILLHFTIRSDSKLSFLSAMYTSVRSFQHFTHVQLSDKICNRWQKQTNIYSPIIFFNIRFLSYDCKTFDAIYKIHESLRLNISFYSLIVFSDCNVFPEDRVSVSSINVGTFFFCGYYSKFFLYPPTNSVQIYFKRLFARLEGYIDVIASKVVENVVPRSHQNFSVTTHYIIEISTYIITYKLQTVKLYRLKVTTIPPANITFYDGPGLKSPKVFKRGQMFRSSYFQCIMQRVTQYEENNVTIVFWSVPFVQEHQQLSEQAELNLEHKSNRRGAHMHSIFKLSSPANATLNVTILNFTYTGEPSLSCLFGGIIVMTPVKDTNGSMKEAMQFCNQGLFDPTSLAVSYAQYLYPGQECSLILFSYEHYSLLETSFSLSYTFCKNIFYNPCKHIELATYIFNTRPFTNPGSTHLDLNINLKTASCYALHASTNVNFQRKHVVGYRPDFCIFRLPAAEIEAAGSQVLKYEHHGYLEQEDLFEEHRLHKSVVNKTVKYVEFPRDHGDRYANAQFYDWTYSWINMRLETTNIPVQTTTYQIKPWLFAPRTLLHNKDDARGQVLLMKLQNKDTTDTSTLQVRLTVESSSLQGKLAYYAKLTFICILDVENYFMLAVPGYGELMELESMSETESEILYHGTVDGGLKYRPSHLDTFRKTNEEDIELYLFEKHTLTKKYYFLKIFKEGHVKSNFLDWQLNQRSPDEANDFCVSEPLSWKSAADLCARYDAHLPEFFSRNEEEEFLSLLKNMHDNYIEALYIGLKNRWNGKHPVAFQNWIHFDGTTKSLVTSQVQVTPSNCKDVILFWKDGEGYYAENPDKRKINNVKNRTLGELYPTRSEGLNCTILLASNLASPEWIQINCREKILNHVVCEKRLDKSNSRVQAQVKYESCQKSDFLKGRMCYHFIWVNITFIGKLNQLCKNTKMAAAAEGDIKEFNFVFNALSLSNILIMLPNTSNTYKFYQEKILFKRSQIKAIVSTVTEEGFTVCKYKPQTTVTDLDIIHACENSIYISTIHVGNGVNDCRDFDNSDELKCNHSGFCCKERKNEHLTYKLFNISAMPSKDDDKTAAQNTSVSDVIVKCSMSEQLPCEPNHATCFYISQICIYQLDRLLNLIPCETGEHLNECSEFECNMRYKCPNYYCLPWAYVCDGKWDCPLGEDESADNTCGINRLCVNMFKCRNVQICTHTSDICNGMFDCPQGDDEIMCDIKHSCPSACICLNYAVSCDKHYTQSKDITGLKYMFYYISFTSIANINFLEDNNHVTLLIVPNNTISKICGSLNGKHTVDTVDVSLNQISLLSSGCLFNLSSLQVIDLSKNSISKMQSKSFLSIKILHKVNLSYNKIKYITKNVFLKIMHFGHLVLYNNPLTDIKLDMFQGLFITNILTHEFHICCVAPPKVTCTADPPWYVSCSKLFPNNIMRISFVLVCTIILSSNLLSAGQRIGKVTQSGEAQIFDIITIFLNFGDLLCGLYLMIIWAADTFYGATFIVKDFEWRSSAPCFSATAIILLFSLLTPFILTFLSLARLMIVLYPFRSSFKKKYFVTKVLACGLLSLTLSALLFTIMMNQKAAIPSNLCSPFIDPTDTEQTIKVATLTVAAVQIISLILICIMYVLLNRSVTSYLESTAIHSGLNNKNITLQFLLVTVSNLFCWLPTSIIHLSSLFLSTYSTDLLIWTTIAIMPINSVINPFFLILCGRNSHRKRSLKTSESTKTLSVPY